MTKRLLLALGLVALPVLGQAQASASFELRLGLPVVLPQLVVITPGVQVVPDFEEEVFFTDGWYWVRHDRGWYRSRSHRGGWVLAPVRAVPARLVSLPPGRYKRYKPAKVRHEYREERRDDRRDWRHESRHEVRDRHDDHGDRHDRKHKHKD